MFKAEIKTKRTKAFIITVAVLLAIFAICFIPVHTDYAGRVLNIFEFELLYYYSSNSGKILFNGGGAPLCLIPAGLAVLMILWRLAWIGIVKRCSLSLTSDGIEGNRKYFFSNKMLKLPIEKVDNISIENRFLDKLLGGNTLEIRSASGVIRFICVQNAEEFLNKTLEAIKAFQIPEKINKQNTGNNTDDELSKIVKLKEMLDSGIITQEEFDEKKKQLLNL